MATNTTLRTLTFGKTCAIAEPAEEIECESAMVTAFAQWLAISTETKLIAQRATSLPKRTLICVRMDGGIADNAVSITTTENEIQREQGHVEPPFTTCWLRNNPEI